MKQQENILDMQIEKKKVETAPDTWQDISALLAGFSESRKKWSFWNHTPLAWKKHGVSICSVFFPHLIYLGLIQLIHAFIFFNKWSSTRHCIKCWSWAKEWGAYHPHYIPG